MLWPDRIAIEWLKRPDVRRALHAASVNKLEWAPCSDKLHYAMKTARMIPVHQDLLARGEFWLLSDS